MSEDIRIKIKQLLQERQEDLTLITEMVQTNIKAHKNNLKSTREELLN